MTDKLKHDWKCVSPGDYDFTYECQRCGAVHVENADNPATRCPETGCTRAPAESEPVAEIIAQIEEEANFASQDGRDRMATRLYSWLAVVKNLTQPPNAQAHIDAALESVAHDIYSRGRISIEVGLPVGPTYEAVIDIIRSRIGTSPLAEAQAQIAELQAEIEGLRDIIARAYDNLNDLPVSKEWASKWCDDADTALSDAAMQKEPHSP